MLFAFLQMASGLLTNAETVVQRRSTKMQATTIYSANTQIATEKEGSSSSIRALQNSFLTELPGVAFALLTLVYVVSSLIRL